MDILELEKEDPDMGALVIDPEVEVEVAPGASSVGGVGVACCPLTIATMLDRTASAARMEGRSAVVVEAKVRIRSQNSWWSNSRASMARATFTFL